MNRNLTSFINLFLNVFLTSFLSGVDFFQFRSLSVSISITRHVSLLSQLFRQSAGHVLYGDNLLKKIKVYRLVNFNQ